MDSYHLREGSLRLLRFFQELLFNLLETGLLFLAIGFVSLQTSTGRDVILGWISHYLAHQIGYELQVSSATWDLPCTWTFQRAHLSKAEKEGLHFDRVQIQCRFEEISSGSLPFQIDVVGINKTWNVNAHGIWQFYEKKISIQSCEGTLGEFFQLQKPFVVALSSPENSLTEPIFFRFGKGSIEAAWQQSYEVLHLQLEAIAFPPELFQLLVPGLPFSTPLSCKAHLDWVNQHLRLSQFQVQETSGSVLNGTGQVELSHELPFSLQLQADHLLVLDSPYVKAWAKGEAVLHGNKNHAQLEGELEGQEVLISIDNAPTFSVPSIEFQYIKAPKVHTTAITPAFLDLDLRLKFPKKFFITSEQLQSEWKGNLHLTGPTNKIFFDGEVHLVKGEYALNDQKLRLSQGTLHLSGPMGKMSTLYLVMEKELDRVRAELLVKGPVSDLKLSFRSSPPLTQREILSYLLFDRALNELSSEQGELVSDSFISLNQIQQGQSGDFFSKIKQKIGVIDRLGVNGEGLYLGKYLTKKLLVSFKKGINTLDNRFSVEAKLHKNLKAEAEINTGGEGEGRVSLKWKKEY